MGVRMLLLCAALPLLACRAGGAGDDEQTDTSSESGETSPDACSTELPCEAGYCVAPWDEQTRMRGVAECVAECVGELALDRFCIDDASCCEGLECAIDGLCEPPWQPSETDSGTSETDSGTSDSGTSETSTSTSTSESG
jgi:hypothetical protein